MDLETLMKQVITRVVAAVVLVAWSQVASAQTVEEILDKSLAALGGRAAIEKVKSRTATGEITIGTPAGDITGTISTVNAAPNKQRTVIKADLSAFGVGPLEIDQRFDGTTGYVLDTLQGNRDITGNQLDNMRNSGFPHPFLTYKGLGIAAKLQGKEKVGDREAYVIVFEPAQGSAVRQYVDAATFMPVRFVIKAMVPQLGTEVEQTTDLSDYRDVDGIKVPFKMSASSPVQSMTVVLSKVEHNGAVDEKQFAKPQ
jgi:predicted thioesterase